jgi:hypothetical protein
MRNQIMEDNDVIAEQRLRVMRIIVAALVIGAANFLVIAVYLQESGQMPPPDQEVLSYHVGIPYAIALLVAHFMIPSLMATAHRRRMARTQSMANTPEKQSGSSANLGPWYNFYQTRLIVGAAMLEGAALYFVIAYLLEGTAFSLAAAGCFILGIAVKFPTRDRVERWIGHQQELLQEETTL